MLIISDNSKNQQKKIVVMIIGCLFFFFGGLFLSNNADLFGRRLSIDFLTSFMSIVGIAAYIVSAVCLLWGVPIYFIVSKSGKLSVYDWGVEGAGISGNPYAIKKLEVSFDKLVKPPQIKKDIVYLYTSKGKFSYYASSEANAKQICEAIQKRMK